MKLLHKQIDILLQELDGWSFKNNALEKMYVFKTFVDTLAFVASVGALAIQKNHHPDIDIRYTTVILRVHTHSEGGVTEKDSMFAQNVDSLEM
jgi:4a-hydroxytetrahydrobiopterin dehydratase